MTDSKSSKLTIEQLSAHRDKQGLSVAEVANRIKVSREIINYIEEGEFNRIGSPTFIRGHVGNYAKEIGLDPRSVLSLVPEEHLKPFEMKLSSSKVSNPLSRVKTQSGGFGRYVLGTFLVAALGLSFYFVYDKWDNGQQDNVIQTVQLNQDTSTKDNNKQKKVIYSSLLPQADLPEQQAVQEENIEAVDHDEKSEIMTESFDGDTEPSETPMDEADSDAVEAPQQTDAVNQDESDKPMYSIHFNLAEQAWVSVKTQSGTPVITDLIGPGERHYSANEAMHFRIGNASNTELKINGVEVDMSQNTRQNVADFNWPKDQD
ncbi:helix-turn-helix domain-containing protein [Marinicella gelatinilytica]|uniref:helix-turn-helix domain-containing protein n=1 Tax=Marinicella gelatinilytica TaxID=2996017 RepID=UPI0022609C62|nr:helix-turn-helix domain-containing protein [Marinicella gelatinilytica]MCX7545966.1 DUF4115 domain-containing protein [Marinicella gelatinilytica]